MCVLKRCLTHLSTSNNATLLPCLNVLGPLREILQKKYNFWDCPSDNKWPLHDRVDRQAKSCIVSIRYPNKESWGFCCKSECDNLIKSWQMFFEKSPYKGNNFLDTYDSEGATYSSNICQGRELAKLLWPIQLYMHLTHHKPYTHRRTQNLLLL